MDFDTAQKLFRADKIRELWQDPTGLRYLKLRSLSRGPTLLRVFRAADIEPAATTASQLFREAYDSPQIGVASIDATIRELYEEQRSSRRLNEPELVSQLYGLQEFNWGGLHQNSLEKTIVDNYVKKITSYDALRDKIDNELQTVCAATYCALGTTTGRRSSSRMYFAITDALFQPSARSRRLTSLSTTFPST